MKSQIFATALLGISLAAGCSDDSGPTGPAASTLPQTMHRIVSNASPVCAGSDETYGTLEYPCEQFSIVPPRRGTLVVRLTWSGQNTFLRVGAGSRDLGWSDSPCSTAGCEARFLVAGRGTATVAVALDTRRSHTASQPFDVTVSLE